MELFDSLLDDEILLRRPETPVAEVLAQHRELRNAYGGLLATLVLPDLGSPKSLDKSRPVAASR